MKGRVLITIDFVVGNGYRTTWDTVDVDLETDTLFDVLERWITEIRRTHPKDNPLFSEVEFLVSGIVPETAEIPSSWIGYLENQPKITLKAFSKPLEPKYQFPVT